ncbi:cdc42 effector protein 3-like [Oncorhynchus kisutch]|uniref:Cdc42 effector protein 3-like n=1 Tax=Oncorhynchus kisutch TaxID=8019 RepID=A0A8C7G6F0_ONCKI|nr:cdc42 effector protein 3-like [Oncorhynchus kisutch]XP_031684866.1 cdc42 effector protein 3-like [Oncorhynchus kisutch]
MPLKMSLCRKPASARWSRTQKRREVLSVNMISLPLADFCHVAHIGNNASSDSFGDLSFLKGGHSLILHSSQSEHNLFLACYPPPKPPRLNLGEAEALKIPEWTRAHLSHSTSERRKEYRSLPMLDSEEGEGAIEASVSTSHGVMVSSHSPGRGSLSSGRDGDSTQTCHENTLQLDEVDNSFSFSLDLGPSILDDVLQVMDRLHY